MRKALKQVVILTHVAAALAIGQSPLRDLSALCERAKTTDAAEPALVGRHQSPELQSALRSESTWWALLIDRSTTYMDRMAAAYRGGNMVSPHQLPRLWKLYAEVEVQPSGVHPSPCEFIYSAALRPDTWPVRNEQVVDFPLDSEGRTKMPWAWQMQRALHVLVDQVGKHYTDPHRYRAMTEAAVRWQPANFYEHRIRTQALDRGPRNALWIENMVKLAIQNGDGTGPMAVTGLYVFGRDSYRLEELVHTGLIAILEQSRDERVAEQAAFNLRQMANQKQSWPWEWKPLRSDTGILAVARWALDQKLAVYTRYFFASEICRMIEDPPFKPDSSLDPKSPEVPGSLARFETWLAREQPRLERGAAKESPHIQALAAELHLSRALRQ